MHMATRPTGGRYTINTPPKIGELLEAKALADKRSVSNYVLLLIEEDLRKSGELGEDVGTEEILRASRELGRDSALKALRRELRRKERTA